MKFSIITITKNNIEGLKKTYESIVNQTYLDYEWVVIDGDSNDGTSEWLENNSIKIFLSEKDNGIYNAMNKGINLSNGTYMLFLNSGDSLYNKDTLLKINEFLNDTIYFAYGSSIDFNKKNQFYKKTKSHKTFWFRMFTHHQSMLFRNFSEFKIQYNENYKYSSDYDLVSKIFKNYLSKNNILKLDFPISKFELGGEHKIHRKKAMKEDFQIRKNNLKMNSILNLFIYYLHIIHEFIKNYFPFFHKIIRYSK